MAEVGIGKCALVREDELYAVRDVVELSIVGRVRPVGEVSRDIPLG